MAFMDSADLLARCKRESGVPSTSAFPADADWYAWLTEAQQEVYSNFLGVGLNPQDYSAPTAMSTADSGKTYTFSGSIRPYAVLIYTYDGGELMTPGAYDDPEADYVWENDSIRMPLGKTRTFANSGPVARVIAPPTTIASGVEPTLQPDFARVLIVHRACAYWAGRGGLRDPKPFEDRYNKAWYGEPARGNHGLLGQLKGANLFSGAEAFGHGSRVQGRNYVFAKRG